MFDFWKAINTFVLMSFIIINISLTGLQGQMNVFYGYVSVFLYIRESLPV